MILNFVFSFLLAFWGGSVVTDAMGSGKEIEVVVHRGANHLAPENTVASALAALEEGATWIELDVRISKDSVMYNLHDETLDRTTDGHGLLRDATSQEVDKLDAGEWFSPAFKGTHVPRISEMLDALKGKASIFFDVKRGTPVRPLVELVHDRGYEHDCFFWFADPQMLQEFIRLAPEMKIKVNAHDIHSLKKWQEVCTPAYVEIAPENITEEFRAYCHVNGIHVMAAIQNGSKEAYLKAIAACPDLVNLDRPELWKQVIGMQEEQ